MSTFIVFEYPRSYSKYSSRQEGDMKKFLYRWPANIRHHPVKFSHRGVVLPGIFAPLICMCGPGSVVDIVTGLSVCLYVRNKCNACFIYFCNFHTFGIFHLFCRKMSFDFSVACLSTHSSHISIHPFSNVVTSACRARYLPQWMYCSPSCIAEQSAPG